MLMLFLFSPSFLVGGLAASSRQEVKQLWYCWGFFDKVVVGVLVEKNL